MSTAPNTGSGAPAGAPGKQDGADDSAWIAHAACRGVPTSLFYPTRGEVLSALVRGLCQCCPVAEQCLSTALARHDSYGVWGGHTGDQRRPLRRAWLKAKSDDERRELVRNAVASVRRGVTTASA
jgi:WhiB family redox-sensing transcriptional regulator